MPAISVIVPVYKVEKYIRRCVDSILNQTYTDFELILVDDGSPDNCGAICDEYAAKDSRIVVIHQENGGLSAARNAGIDWAFAHSDSQWLSFIDSDDLVHSCFLEKLLQAAQANNVDVSCCRFQRFYDEIAPKTDLDAPVCLRRTEDIYCAKDGIQAYAIRFLYKKSLFANIRYPIGRLYEDIFTTPKIIFQSDWVAEVEQELYYYFYRCDSLAHSRWSPAQLDIIAAYEENFLFFRSYEGSKIDKCLARGYLNAIHAQANNVHNSSLDQGTKRHYSKYLKKRMRIALFRYSKQADICISAEGWLFAVAYPKLMTLYWLLQGQIQKFCPRIRQH